MASEPYCAEAPSRSTSTRSRAPLGMAFRSTAAEPRPTVPLTLTRAEAWRRVPLTSTRVWSGDRPRRLAGRIESVPSLAEGRWKVSDGTVWARAAANSVVPRFCRVSAVTTSTGARVSRRERAGARVPVTTMSSTKVASGTVSLGRVWALAVPAISRAMPEAAARRAGRRGKREVISRGRLF
ncbi:hypothetical protein D3C80_1038530 [compost metagenome]